METISLHINGSCRELAVGKTGRSFGRFGTDSILQEPNAAVRQETAEPVWLS